MGIQTEKVRRLDIIGDAIRSCTYTLCKSQGVPINDGFVTARLIHNKVAKEILYEYPNYSNMNPMGEFLKDFPIDKSFQVRIDLVKGRPKTDNGTCKLKGSMWIQYKSSDRTLITKIATIDFPESKKPREATCSSPTKSTFQNKNTINFK